MKIIVFTTHNHAGEMEDRIEDLYDDGWELSQPIAFAYLGANEQEHYTVVLQKAPE
jgi:hypothetical protein|tara:strand:- start:59544 stop:59711 length:168 start_codon:yes stop_codon:yes gene_type:complete